MCAHTRTHCCFSLVELVNEQTNKQKIDEGKTREREKKKCCLDKNLKKKNVVVVVVASSCTHIHIGTQMKIRKGSRFSLCCGSTSTIHHHHHHHHLEKNEFNLSHTVASFRTWSCSVTISPSSSFLYNVLLMSKIKHMHCFLWQIYF